MRKILILIITLNAFNGLFAQDNLLVIEGVKPPFYITHKVLPKENFYSIGRLYNISPKEIAPYNNIELPKGLALGQIIHIPLVAGNFTQTEEGSSKKEALIPVYHIVMPGETLKKIAAGYLTSAENIKKWNNLKTDTPTKGKKLIIGYLRVSKELSPLANKSLKRISLPEPAKTEPLKTEIVKTESVISAPVPESKPIEALPAKTKVKVKTKGNSPIVKTPTTVTPSVSVGAGFFKDLYQDQMKNRTELTESGAAGVFKTTSGWQDAKYYCFYNAAPQGTILKVSNNQSGKIIYAKVLDLIPELKQNTGLILQLSNAAAEGLGVTENKFNCTVTYSK